MQYSPEPQERPAIPGSSLPHSHQPQPSCQPHQPNEPKPRPRRRRFARFVRGYLMLVGALTTLYVLAQLLVRLLIEVGKWVVPG